MSPNQFSVRDLLRRSSNSNDSVRDLELIDRHAESTRSHAQQCPASFSSGDSQRLSALGRVAAGRRFSLIRSQFRVAHDDLDALERHVQLVGNQLAERRLDARAHVDPAGVDGHLAVTSD